MYFVGIPKKVDQTLIIAFEGRLTNSEVLSNDLDLIFDSSQDEITTVKFDMADVVMINESCFKVLSGLKNNYSIEFINCSLFIEEQLTEISKT